MRNVNNSSANRPVLLSVLDRLIDDEPELAEDVPVTRSQSIRDLKDCLLRDLEWLLNTRLTIQDIPESSEELCNSLYVYGLPEFGELTLSTAADRLPEYIESAIKMFEPRLTNVRVTMRASEGFDRVAHFIIDAILLIDPLPERVTFDTVLELTRGEYQIQGVRNA